MDLSDVSYIIPYRYLDNYRRNNLLFVIDYIKKILPEIELFVLEQDKNRTLEDIPGVKYLFLKNEDLFNRSWAFNVAVKHTDKNLFVFADADIIIKKDDLAQAVSFSNSYLAVKPFNIRLHVSNEKTNELYETKNWGVTEKDIIGKAENDPFCAGIVLMTRQCFNEISGWEEKCYGWGAEDDIEDIKIKKFINHKRLYNICWHLYHPRSDKNDFINHYNYQNNVNLFGEYARMRQDELLKIIKETKLTIGNINKYDKG